MKVFLGSDLLEMSEAWAIYLFMRSDANKSQWTERGDI